MFMPQAASHARRKLASVARGGGRPEDAGALANRVYKHLSMDGVMKKTIATAVLAGLLAVASQGAWANTQVTNDFPGFPGVANPLSTSLQGSFSDTILGQNVDFTDNWMFSVAPGGSFNALVASISLSGIFGIDSSTLKMELLSKDALGNYTAVTPWSFATTTTTPAGSVSTVSFANLLQLAPNTSYELQIMGTTDGSVSGGYTGAFTFNVAAVPEPETYALMLAGLGMLGWVASRRRKNV